MIPLLQLYAHFAVGLRTSLKKTKELCELFPPLSCHEFSVWYQTKHLECPVPAAWIPVGATTHLIWRSFFCNTFGISLSPFHSCLRNQYVSLVLGLPRNSARFIYILQCPHSSVLTSLPHLVPPYYYLHLHFTNWKYTSFASLFSSQHSPVLVRRVLLFQTLIFTFSCKVQRKRGDFKVLHLWNMAVCSGLPSFRVSYDTVLSWYPLHSTDDRLFWGLHVLFSLLLHLQVFL